MTLVDTNILIDLLVGDPRWFVPSHDALTIRSAAGPVRIVDCVFAEVSAGFATAKACADFIDKLGIGRAPMSDDGLWQAGQAYRLYRSRSGTKTNVLPDFFIGAQAHVEGLAILTRDARRYRTYFPDVHLIEP